MKGGFLLPGKGLPASGGGAQKALMAAIAAARAGQFDAALVALRSDAGALKSPVGQNVLGDVLLKQGKATEALKAFDAAAKLAPQMPEAHANRGAALEALGRLEEALAAEDRAIRLRPDYVTAHFNRGNMLAALVRFEDAVAAFGNAIKRAPDHADAHLNRGMALLGLDRTMEALADFDRAIAINPKLAGAHVGRAGAFRDLGQFVQALAAIDAAAALEPANIDAALVRSSVLIAMERFDDALSATEALAGAHPHNGLVLAARATALQKLKRFEDALVAADAAVAFEPKKAEPHTIRGIVLAEMGKLDDALTALERARELGASGAMFHNWRGVALSGYGDMDEALAALDRAAALEPDNPTVLYNRAMTRLALGQFEGGWEDHEARLKLRDNAQVEITKHAPQWLGENLAGKKLLVYSEQGHGDTIQFVRYLPMVASQAAEVTFVASEPVRRLFEANFPNVDVTDKMGFRTGFDFQTSVMSLPRRFGTTLDTVPADVPYLHADAERVAKWRGRLGSGFKVGLVWQGNPKFGRDRDRSIALQHFAPLAEVAGVRFISLQSHGGIDQLKNSPPGMTIETLGEEVVNNPDGFREVAAVMQNLDLIVTSDTGPAHLAGALGRPTWVALMHRPDWRWMRDGEMSPWYPTMRLFRQSEAGDWPGVFRRIAAALRAAARP